jgi:hypothetical protein
MHSAERIWLAGLETRAAGKSWKTAAAAPRERRTQYPPVGFYSLRMRRASRSVSGIDVRFALRLPSFVRVFLGLYQGTKTHHKPRGSRLICVWAAASIPWESAYLHAP